jgi:hypothetical protein
MTGAAAKGSGRLDVAAADNVPFLVVYGSQDSDVDGVRLVNQLDKHGTGFRHYDRSTAQKAMIFINGANHNRFNTTWGNDDIGHITGTIIPAGDQRTLAQEYIGAFFSSFMSGVTTDIGLLTGESNNSLATDVAVQWQFGSAVKVVDDFEPAQVGAMHADAVVEDFAPLKPTTAKQQHICHNTKALKLPTAPGSALFFVENPGRDPEAYTELLFRLAISFEITDTTIAGTYPNFKITIKDEPGTSATVKSSDIYTQNPLGRTVPTRHKVDAAPYMTPPPTAPVEQDVTKICFETYRVPLSLFPGLQMDKLDEIRFDFDAPTTAIDVFIDSIALVKR